MPPKRYPFTPPVSKDTQRCLARTWAAGSGGQCTRRRSGAEFCASHAAGAWRAHGRVSGPIPAKKLAEFERTNAPSASSVADRASALATGRARSVAKPSAPKACVVPAAQTSKLGTKSAGRPPLLKAHSLVKAPLKVCETPKPIAVQSVLRRPAGSNHAAGAKRAEARVRHPEPALRRGTRVQLQALQGSRELNGKEAICLLPSDRGLRWLVHVDGDEEARLRRVPRENLEVRATSPGGCLCDSAMRRTILLLQQNTRLRKRLREVEVTREAVVSGIAALECEPLRHCLGPSERGDLRRRLMLKWHPDKAPSEQHRQLSTEVSQDLQNHAEWRS